MLKRALLLGLLLLPLPAMAQTASVQDQIVSQLHDQGFTKIEVSRTLLGRVRLHATSDQLERELVFNPTTGEILRDYWEDREQDAGGARQPRVLDPGRDNRNDSAANARATDDRSESKSGKSVRNTPDDRSGSNDNSSDKPQSSGRGSSNDSADASDREDRSGSDDKSDSDESSDSDEADD